MLHGMKTKSSTLVLLSFILLGATAPLLRAQTITDALDLPGATWTTSGTPPWTPQGAGAHDGVDAAALLAPQPFVSYEYAELSTTVTGPGVVRFWWKLDNSTNSSGYQSGAYFSMSSGERYYTNAQANVGWAQVELPVPFYGANLLRWQYGRWQAYDLGQDAAWLDEVTFTPTTPVAPNITNQPAGQTVFAGGKATFTVGMDGTPPFYYQWRRNGTPIADATDNALRLYNVSPADAGNYDVVVTNLLGQRTSTPASLTVLPAISLATALDTTDLVWETSGDGLWFGQTHTTHDGVDAVQTGGADLHGLAYLITQVNGPGTLSFWWKQEFQNMSLEITNNTGTVLWTNSDWIADWSQPVVTIGEGVHTLLWSFFIMPPHGDMDFDSKGFLDQVVWTGGGAPPTGPQLVSPRVNSQGKFQFGFQSQAGKHYYAEYKNALTDLGWTPLSDFDGDGGMMTVTDPVTPGGPRFYRIRTQ